MNAFSLGRKTYLPRFAQVDLYCLYREQTTVYSWFGPGLEKCWELVFGFSCTLILIVLILELK